MRLTRKLKDLIAKELLATKYHLPDGKFFADRLQAEVDKEQEPEFIDFCRKALEFCNEQPHVVFRVWETLSLDTTHHIYVSSKFRFSERYDILKNTAIEDYRQVQNDINKFYEAIHSFATDEALLDAFPEWADVVEPLLSREEVKAESDTSDQIDISYLDKYKVAENE